MGFLHQLSTVASPSNLRVTASEDYRRAFWSGDPLPGTLDWLAGGPVGSDLALTLSYVYSAVAIISDDFGTSTCQLFEDLGSEGSRRVSYQEPGIGVLARKLRWAPNSWQTAKAFWSTLAWQYLLRPAAYAEVVYRSDAPLVIDQIVPRHPDRVQQEVLAGGRLRFKITEPTGQPRYVNQDEMLVVRNTSFDGLNALGRLDYGAPSLDAALALQSFTRNYFRHGATAALLATYKGGDMEDEEEAALHSSITRFVSGVDNAGGLLLVPEDIDVKALGVDPEKAQLLGLKNMSGRDVARLFKMPSSWLNIEGAASYSSQVQDAQNYVNRCQMPMRVEFEQAIQRDLVLAESRYFAKFNADYMLRADQEARMRSYEIGIRSRVLRPSECRVREDLPPDPALDKLSEGDFRPGTPRGDAQGTSSARAMAIARASAQRVVRRERAAIVTAATKHARDSAAFGLWADTFFAQHAAFVAEAMGMTGPAAAEYCAEQRHRLKVGGVADVHLWEETVPDRLAERALAADVTAT